MNRLNLFFLVIGSAVLISNVEARLEHKIVGGDYSKDGEYTYQVSLQNTALKRNKCGGSIIGKRHIITAAHCVTTLQNEFVNTPMMIVGGAKFIQSIFDKLRVVVDVDKIYIPKEFNRTAKVISADVAVIRLKNDLPLDTNPHLSKLELPDQRSFAGEQAVVTGYGWNLVVVAKDKKTGAVREAGGVSDNMLRFAKVDILTTEQCNEIYTENPLTEKHICGKVIQRNPTKPEGICAGDSGGPLVFGGKTLIGVVSTSPLGCTEKTIPAIYTRVSAFLDFIDKAVNDKDDDPEIRSTTL